MRTKRLAVILLTFCMIITMTPFMSFAEPADEGGEVSGIEAAVDEADADAGEETADAVEDVGEDPVGGGDRLGNGHDQVRELDQLDEDL